MNVVGYEGPDDDKPQYECVVHDGAAFLKFVLTASSIDPTNRGTCGKAGNSKHQFVCAKVYGLRDGFRAVNHLEQLPPTRDHETWMLPRYPPHRKSHNLFLSRLVRFGWVGVRCRWTAGTNCQAIPKNTRGGNDFDEDNQAGIGRGCFGILTAERTAKFFCNPSIFESIRLAAALTSSLCSGRKNILADPMRSLVGMPSR